MYQHFTCGNSRNLLNDLEKWNYSLHLQEVKDPRVDSATFWQWHTTSTPSRCPKEGGSCWSQVPRLTWSLVKQCHLGPGGSGTLRNPAGCPHVRVSSLAGSSSWLLEHEAFCSQAQESCLLEVLPESDPVGPRICLYLDTCLPSKRFVNRKDGHCTFDFHGALSLPNFSSFPYALFCPLIHSGLQAVGFLYWATRPKEGSSYTEIVQRYGNHDPNDNNNGFHFFPSCFSKS